VRKAIDRTLAAGVVTEDLTAPGQRSYRTSAVGDFIAAQI
jgi:3-isopropylmalate dehydrogenase